MSPGQLTSFPLLLWEGLPPQSLTFTSDTPSATIPGLTLTSIKISVAPRSPASTPSLHLRAGSIGSYVDGVFRLARVTIVIVQFHRSPEDSLPIATLAGQGLTRDKEFHYPDKCGQHYPGLHIAELLLTAARLPPSGPASLHPLFVFATSCVFIKPTQPAVSHRSALPITDYTCNCVTSSLA